MATNLLGPMPTEQVICCSSATTARSVSPIWTALPKSRVEPVTSRKASSMEAASTTGVNWSKTAITARETVA